MTLLSYLFEQKKVHFIELDTALFNIRARSCFEACGFIVQKQMKFVTMNGWPEERLVMQMTSKQWSADS